MRLQNLLKIKWNDILRHKFYKKGISVLHDNFSFRLYLLNLACKQYVKLSNLNEFREPINILF